MRELELQRRVVQLIKDEGGKCIPIRVDMYAPTGTPDVIGSFMGRAIALELKTGRSGPTAIQIVEMKAWEKAGALVRVCRSLDDVRSVLQEIARDRY